MTTHVPDIIKIFVIKKWWTGLFSRSIIWLASNRQVNILLRSVIINSEKSEIKVIEVKFMCVFAEIINNQLGAYGWLAITPIKCVCAKEAWGHGFSSTRGREMKEKKRLSEKAIYTRTLGSEKHKLYLRF